MSELNEKSKNDLLVEQLRAARDEMLKRADSLREKLAGPLLPDDRAYLGAELDHAIRRADAHQYSLSQYSLRVWH